jgi:hypothetical protein
MLRIDTLQDVKRVLCLYGIGFLLMVGVVAVLPQNFCWMHLCWIVLYSLYVISGLGLLGPRLIQAIDLLMKEQDKRSNRRSLDLVDW